MADGGPLAMPTAAPAASASARPGRKPRADVRRPPCPDHPGGRVQLDVPYGRWSQEYERVRYRCFPREGAGWNPERPTSTSHRFSPTTVRHPTEHHPELGGACPHCLRKLEPHEGPKTGRNFMYTAAEIGRALILVSTGFSYRGTAAMVRRGARRAKLPHRETPLPKRRYDGSRPGREDPGPDPRASKEAKLVAGYVDVFAPIVLAPYAPKAWPDRIGVDSHPLRRPARDADGNRIEKGVEAGEIMAITDLSGERAVVWWAGVEGGKDNQSWLRFLRSVPASGAPTIVVADEGKEIALAVAQMWPEVTLYHCHGHLLRRAKLAAAADGIPEYVPLTADELGKAPPRRDGSAPRYKPHPVWEALVRALSSRERWLRFEAAVEAWDVNQAALPPDVPRSRPIKLASWIEDHEALVLGQIAFREMRPDTPKSVGPTEAYFEALRSYLSDRQLNMRNARRLALLIRLIALAHDGRASEGAFTKRVQDWLDVQPRRNWQAGLHAHVDKGASSIARLIERADEEHAVWLNVNEDKKNRRKATEISQRIEAFRIAQGLSPWAGRGRRADRAAGLPRGERSERGTHVTDRAVIAEWDWERNALLGLDPSKLAPSSLKKAHWICREHMNGPNPHEHRFESAIRNRVWEGGQCPVRMNRMACPSTSLRAYEPRIAAEFHPTANAPLTPDNLLPRSAKIVRWICPKGHEYSMMVQHRIERGYGCPDPICKAERTDARRAGRVSANHRKRRQLGRAVMARADESELRERIMSEARDNALEAALAQTAAHRAAAARMAAAVTPEVPAASDPGGAAPPISGMPVVRRKSRRRTEGEIPEAPAMSADDAEAIEALRATLEEVARLDAEAQAAGERRPRPRHENVMKSYEDDEDF